jgi:hypothetical protein
VQVWPYLLGHYKFKSTSEDRHTLDETVRTEYERVMSEWLAVEAIVRQRDKEVVAANLAKLSQVCNNNNDNNNILHFLHAYTEKHTLTHPYTSLPLSILTFDIG